jgi:hypothetical protein
MLLGGVLVSELGGFLFRYRKEEASAYAGKNI